MEGAVPVLVQEKKLGTELSPADFDGANPISRTNVVIAETVLSIEGAQHFGQNREAHPYPQEVRPEKSAVNDDVRVGSPGSMHSRGPEAMPLVARDLTSDMCEHIAQEVVEGLR